MAHSLNRFRVPGFGIRDSEFGIRDSGLGIQDSGLGIRDSDLGITEEDAGVVVGRKEDICYLDLYHTPTDSGERQCKPRT